MISIKDLRDSLLHLFFPHVCTSCGTDIISSQSQLCMKCMEAMPETGFELHPENPVEKIFRGRIKIHTASAQYYFTKESLMQHLMHQFKYKGNKELGLQLGRLMGEQIKKSNRFAADALIPLPLYADKERKRGYNQATILCEGMAAALQIPVLDKAIIRPLHTETQTKKGRVERWRNIEGKFLLQMPESIQNKHVLLVDDVITTGATLESCGAELLKADGVTLSIITLCTATR